MSTPKQAAVMAREISVLKKSVMATEKSVVAIEKQISSKKESPQVTRAQYEEMMVILRETRLLVLDMRKRFDQFQLEKNPSATVVESTKPVAKKRKSANLLISAAIVDPVGKKKLQEILGSATFSAIHAEVAKTKKETDPTFDKMFGKLIWEHVRDAKKKDGNKDLYESIRDTLTPIFDK